MKVLIQRVTEAKVVVDEKTVGAINLGLLVLLGVGQGDGPKEADWLAEKIVNLRIFGDAKGRMNLSLLDVKGGVLLVSQFTLEGDCQKGRRPSYGKAAPPEIAEKLYQYLGQKLSESVPVEYGVFGAHMMVTLVNDGPVTFMVEKNPTLGPFAAN
ncbi:MAG: D-tyrosyl-tRNA(Tyr) deacylase [Deltaproteobacteria bacterium]|nr:D-tyrosyl-tRNA(Tyr) deacylase [Deltaproteobacteria bacterium]